jgi:hypothetical protein
MAGRMFMVLRRFCMMFCALLAHMAFDAFSFFLRVEPQIGSRSIRIRLQYAEWIAWHQRLRPRSDRSTTLNWSVPGSCTSDRFKGGEENTGKTNETLAEISVLGTGVFTHLLTVLAASELRRYR